MQKQRIFSGISIAAILLSVASPVIAEQKTQPAPMGQKAPPAPKAKPTPKPAKDRVDVTQGTDPETCHVIRSTSTYKKGKLTGTINMQVGDDSACIERKRADADSNGDFLLILDANANLLKNPNSPGAAEWSQKLLNLLANAPPERRRAYEAQMSEKGISIDNVLSARAFGLVNAYKNPNTRETALIQMRIFSVQTGFGDRPGLILNSALIAGGVPQGIAVLGNTAETNDCRTVKGQTYCGPVSKLPPAEELSPGNN